MAENRFPYLRNRLGAPMRVFMGKVQAGSTQAIKRGEVCAWNKTAGYWIPVSAVLDGLLYLLAVSNEEQPAGGLERYMEFILPQPGDEFEFALAATRAAAVGEGFTLTAADSQKLTYSATAYPVFTAVGIENYPEVGTTLGNRASAIVEMNPECSICKQFNTAAVGPRKVVTLSDNTTLRNEQSGTIFLVDTDAKVITLPATKAGVTFTFVNIGADGGVLLSISPQAADAIYYVTSVNDKDLLNTKATAVEGDMVTIVGDGATGWFVTAIKGTWAKQG